jgi:hypothetical protein
MIKVQLHDYKYCQDLWIDDNPALFALLSVVEMVEREEEPSGGM